MSLLRCRFVRAGALVIGALALLLVVWHVVDYVRLDAGAFRRSADALIERSRRIREGARPGYQDAALAALPRNSHNGPFFRLDEMHHAAAVIEEPPERAVLDEAVAGVIYGFEFDNPDNPGLASGQGTSTLTVRDGSLVVDADFFDHLTNVAPLDLPKDEIGEILIRARVDRGTRMRLAWSKETEPKSLWGHRLDTQILADDRFHLYAINAKNVLKRGLRAGDRLQKIFIKPSNAEEGATVEIDFIRFISKRAKYMRHPHGGAYETIGREMRRVLYMLTPQALEWVLTVPERAPTLEFGIGAVLHDVPIGFEVSVREGGVSKRIFSRRLAGAEAWKDVRLDLSAWAGREVALSLRAAGSGENVAFWSVPLVSSEPEKRVNVLIVLEDALRSDRLSVYGHDVPTSPFKERLMERGGILFASAVSQATKTRPSIPSLMTSLLPSGTGVWNWSDMLDEEYLTLPEVLRSQGYRTASFIQNGNAGPYAGLHQGFETILTEEMLGTETEGLVSEPVLSWIERNRHRNFFAYMHCLDPHGPYDPPAPFDRWHREATGEKTPAAHRAILDPDHAKRPTVEGRRRRYDGEVLHNDAVMERLVGALEEMGILGQTLIVFVADHGEHLGEHGLWEHGPPGFLQVTGVPLMLFYPERFTERRTFDEPVMLMDVMPTVLDLAGVETGGLLLMGDSLVDLAEGRRGSYYRDRIVISEEPVDMDRAGASRGLHAIGSLFHRDRHFIASAQMGPARVPSVLKMRVFDVAADRAEERPLLSFMPDLYVKYLQMRTLDAVQANGMAAWKAWTEGSARDEHAIDPDVLDRLRALGYVD